MASLKELNRQMDEVRDRVFALPKEKQKIYYRKEAEQMRDPDTYAVLNYAFALGVHHLYLGKYVTFFVEMFLLYMGIFLIFCQENSALFVVGIVSVFCVTIKGAYEMFCSEKMVMQYNLNKANEILEDVKPPAF